MKQISLVIGLFLSTTAWARESPGFGGVRLVEGTVDFESCLSAPACAGDFYRFLGQGTLEQGFAMEGASVATSAVVNRHTGWVAGGLLHTFPFAGPRENLAGKEENTQFSPVFPKILAGKLFDRGDAHYAWGITLLPPVPVNGASALNVGLDASMAKTLDDGSTRVGLDLDFSFVRARAPVVASKDQMESAEEEGYENNVKQEVFDDRCDPDSGCIDTFQIANLTILGGISWDVNGVLFPYLRGGLAITNEFLYVQYDDSHWRQFGIQPQVQGGAAWTPAEPVFLSLGGATGLKQANQNPADKVGLFYKITGAAAYRF